MSKELLLYQKAKQKTKDELIYLLVDTIREYENKLKNAEELGAKKVIRYLVSSGMVREGLFSSITIKELLSEEES